MKRVSQKRKDLMVRYRLLHHCQICFNPLGSHRSNSLSLASTSDERRSNDSGYLSSHQQLLVTISSEQIPSSSSSTNSSESPHNTRGPSPLNSDYPEVVPYCPLYICCTVALGASAVICWRWHCSYEMRRANEFSLFNDIQWQPINCVCLFISVRSLVNRIR